MPAGNIGSTMCAELNRLANGGNYPTRTAFLDEQGAANKWAGTTGKSLVAALNIKNGTTNPSLFKNLGAVCNALASTTGKSPLAALTSISGVTSVGYFAYGRSSGNNAIYAYTFSDDSGVGSATTNLTAITIGASGNTFTGDTSPGAIAFMDGFQDASTTSTMRAYRYTTAGGIGTAYTAVTSGTTYQDSKQAAFAGGYGAIGFALGFDTSRFKMYSWSDSTGFGTAYSGTGISTTSQTISWAPNNGIATFGCNGDGTVGNRATLVTFPWSNSTGLGTAFATHALAGPRGVVTSVGVNNSSNVIWAVGNYDGNLHFITYTSSSYGTYLGSVAYSGASYMSAAAFNSTDTQMVASNSASTPRGYAWSNATGVGTQYSNPSSFTNLAQGRNKVTFTSSDKSVVIGQDTYAWGATGFGTKYAIAAGLPTTITIAVLGK